MKTRKIEGEEMKISRRMSDIQRYIHVGEVVVKMKKKRLVRCVIAALFFILYYSFL